MKKKKKSLWKRIPKNWVSNFSSNVLGVIIGIVLTFGVSYLVQRHDEKKQIREIMILIKQELNENKEWLENNIQGFEKDFKAYQVILNPDGWNKIPKDSLMEYIYQAREVTASYSGSDAWNIFQNSGMVQKFNNIDLVTQLSECYFLINKAKELQNEYMKAKAKASGFYEITFDEQPYAYLQALTKNEESIKFFKSIVLFNVYNFQESFGVITSYIDFMLYLIDQHGDYNHQPKIGDEEFEAFLKNHKL